MVELSRQGISEYILLKDISYRMHSLQTGRRCTPLYLVPTKDCPAPKIEAEIPNRTRHSPNCRPKTLQGRPTIIILQIDIYEAIYKMFLRQTTFAIA